MLLSYRREKKLVHVIKIPLKLAHKQASLNIIFYTYIIPVYSAIDFPFLVRNGKSMVARSQDDVFRDSMS